MPRGPWRLLVTAGLVTMLSPVRPAFARSPAPSLLRVPYVAQTELLCGGAAVAMVERWWGRRGVYGEDFAALVRRDEGGIRTTELAAATQARGWHVNVVHGTSAVVREALADSIPVIALVAVAPGRYHYVVIVGWDDARVTYHDPAVGPFRSATPEEFQRQWDATDAWTMLVTPSATGPDSSRVVAPASPPPAPLPCQPWTGRASGAAVEGDLDEADRLLDRADSTCPGLLVLVRERAGIRFRQRRYTAAAALAQRYLAIVPGDSLAWQLLASARYLAGEPGPALDAWNAIGRPTVDLVNIGGVHRIRYPHLLDMIDLPDGTMLTSKALAMADRRLADVPALAASRVGYIAVPGGAVEVDAHVVERPPVPDPVRLGTRAIATALARAEVALSLDSPVGYGERWSARWRWEDVDPVGEIGLEIPVVLGIPTVVSVDGRRERARFDDGTVARRSSASLAARGWLTPAVEAATELRLDDWTAGERSLAVGLGLGTHLARDRLAVLLRAEHDLPLGTGRSFDRAGVIAAWRSAGITSWSARTGIDWSSAATPALLQPIAGGSTDRAIPLRAHRFAPTEGLPTARRATTILHGGVGIDRRLLAIGLMEVGGGLFLDAARRLDNPDPSTRRTWIDGGLGITLGVVGIDERIRLDLARGLRDHTGWVMTVGLTAPWPARLRQQW